MMSGTQRKCSRSMIDLCRYIIQRSLCIPQMCVRYLIFDEHIHQILHFCFIKPNGQRTDLFIIADNNDLFSHIPLYGPYG